MQNKIGNNFFDRLYRVMALTTVACTIAPFLYLFLYHSYEKAWCIALFMPVLLIFLGYGMQALYGGVIKYKRKSDESGYERMQKYFEPIHATLTLTISAIIGFFARYLTDSYLKYRAEMGYESYDPSSLLPYLMMAIVIACIAAGIIMWFFPVSKIVSFRTLFPYMVLFIVAFALHFLLAVPNHGFITFCLIIAVICAFVVMNQSYLIQLIGRSKTSVLTESVRRYNMALTIMLLITLAVALIITVIVMNGIGVIVKTAFFALLKTALSDNGSSGYNSGKNHVDESAREFSEAVFSGLVGGEGTSKALFLVFIVFIIGVILFFILIRKVNIWKAIAKFINDLWNNILAFIMNAIYFNRTVTESFVIPDYKDEELKTDQFAINNKKKKRRAKRSYKSFVSELDTYENYSDRIQYAYQTLAACLRDANRHISESSTPQEIAERLKQSCDPEDVNTVTNVFEKYKYAEEAVNHTEAEKSLNIICRLLHTYLE